MAGQVCFSPRIFGAQNDPMDFLKRYWWLSILLILSLLFFFSSLVYYFWPFGGDSLITPTSEVQIAALPTVPPADKVFNVLLLGHGDPSHPGGDLADALIILHVDTKAKKAAMISIPRDTWVTLPVNGQAEGHKINEAYMVGKQNGNEQDGFEMIKKAVTKVTDLPIHYYAFIDFRGLVQAIDILDGLTVDVPKTFNDPYYPIRGKELDNCGMSPEKIAKINATLSGFELEKQYQCRYENLKFKKGEVEMDGETALKFVRSRHSGTHGGDFARAERQQALLLGIKDKLLTLEALDDAPAFFEKLIYAVRTDIDVNVVKGVVELIVNPDEYEISQLVLSTENAFNDSRNSRGQYILVPKAGEDQWAEIQNLVESTVFQSQ
jgi:LCP family protein required for cell wall assembly